MENKYYYPLINEFKVGFRYEQFTREGGISWSGRLYDKIQKSWIKKTYEIDNPHSLVDIRNYIDSGFIRVKKLDDNDFIDAGWSDNELQTSDFIADFILGKDFTATIFEDTIRINWRHEVLANVRIRNYNELIDVMRMLNINSSENVKS